LEKWVIIIIACRLDFYSTTQSLGFSPQGYAKTGNFWPGSSSWYGNERKSKDLWLLSIAADYFLKTENGF